MIEIQRSALLLYSADKIYDLVNDVAAYPKYMKGCAASRVIDASETEMLAELTVAKAGLKHSFTTRNTLSRPERITLALEDGPFEFFEGTWLIESLAEEACKVNFELRFTIKSPLARRALTSLISGVGTDMVDAVCVRAKQLYG